MSNEYKDWLVDRCQNAETAVKTLIDLLLRLHPEYKDWINIHYKEYLDDE